MGESPGRSCPLSYRHGPQAIAASPAADVETLYVIGGLYGNQPALDAILALAAGEPGPVRLCFNGDFNWFNIDDQGFLAVNRAVLAHDAMLGNVEAELLTPGSEAGCGCAYPENVDADVVERSNRIHARLKATALKHSEIIDGLRPLPMVRRYHIGTLAIGVVHGDAQSLAGWGFDVAALDDENNRAEIDESFRLAEVDVFASTHTCQPVLRDYPIDSRGRLVINNGAAGMPNFRGDRRGLITRIGCLPAICETAYGKQIDRVHIDAIPVGYDHDRWESQFLRNWPAGSAAWASYFERIHEGPYYRHEQACIDINESPPGGIS
ncbi:MAG: hypothetical protein K9K30_13330 [Burkholderiaceae bacterium]|nr:hypothetical protein [Burkholderiaceae bacterium]